MAHQDSMAFQIGRNSWQVDMIGLKAPPKGNFRQTPAGEPEVKDIVAIGAIVRTNYGTGPYRVRSVSSHAWQGLRYYSLACCGVDGRGDFYLNEFVAVGGRLLHLFPNNDDEILLADPAGQLSLL